MQKKIRLLKLLVYISQLVRFIFGGNFNLYFDHQSLGTRYPGHILSGSPELKPTSSIRLIDISMKTYIEPWIDQFSVFCQTRD